MVDVTVTKKQEEHAVCAKETEEEKRAGDREKEEEDAGSDWSFPNEEEEMLLNELYEKFKRK